MFRHILIFLSLVMLCANCSKADKRLESILNSAENCLENFPDSSLAILNKLKIDEISSAPQKAKYALLKSIALDKNYIDVTEDSLTSIAVDYYKKHGTAEECLKSFMYNGNIFANAKDYERAMSNYLEAEEFVEESRDYIIIGRLYSAKTIIYNSIFDFQTAIEQASIASGYFLKGGDTTRFINNLNNIAVIMNNSSLLDSAKKYLYEIEQYWHKLTPSQKVVYYSIQITQTPKTDTAAIMAITDKMLALGNDNVKINWLAVAEAFYKVGDYNSSLKYIKYHKPAGGISDALYYRLLSDISAQDGAYEQAYKFLVKRNDLVRDRYFTSTQTDAKFLEERYDSQIKAVKQKYMIYILGLGVMTVVLMMSFLYKHHKTVSLAQGMRVLALEEESKLKSKEFERLVLEKENYEFKWVEALREQEHLKSIIKSNKGKVNLDIDMMSLIEQRLAVLDKFIAANISSAFSQEAQKGLNDLMRDKKKFLDSTKLYFSLSHSKFIKSLENKDLSEREVACCCLYCIGLNGSEISNYLEMKSFYNISAVIRKKLQIERSVNIDTYLRKMLKQLE